MTAVSAPPHSIVVLRSGKRPTSRCSCRMCCNCVRCGVLFSAVGVLKLTQFLLGLVCQMLLFFYGMRRSYHLGSGTPAYLLFMTVCPACMLNASVLLVSYILSPGTRATVRASLFEVLFNFIACALYLTAACFLAVSSYKLFYSGQEVTSETFHSMTAAYVIGFLAAITHLIDACMALCEHLNSRNHSVRFH